MARIGLNAHLYSPQSSYRSAGVSRYIERLLMHLPAVDPGSDYYGWTNGDVGAWPGWQLSAARGVGDSPLARILGSKPLCHARRGRCDWICCTRRSMPGHAPHPVLKW